MTHTIETQYKGYRFRSRLEARWAVFLDALGVAWQYETEGFDVGEAGWYLPDFFLPDCSWFLEIKPAANLISDEERAKIRALDNDPPNNAWGVIILCGVPSMPCDPSLSRVVGDEGGPSVQNLLNRLNQTFSNQQIEDAVNAARAERFAS